MCLKPSSKSGRPALLGCCPVKMYFWWLYSQELQIWYKYGQYFQDIQSFHLLTELMLMSIRSDPVTEYRVIILFINICCKNIFGRKILLDTKFMQTQIP